MRIRIARLATTVTLIGLAAGAGEAAAQVQQVANPRTFAPTSAKAEAIAHYSAGLEAQVLGDGSGAARHYRMALDAAPDFGVARARLAQLTGGQPAQNEYARAVVDASRGSAGEVLTTLALREAAAGRAPAARAIWDALAQLYPDDVVIAADRAFSRPVAERLAAMREVARRFPNAAGPKLAIANLQIPSVFATGPTPASDDALAAVDAALALKPDGVSALAMKGAILERTLKLDDAMPYLDRATRIAPLDWAYELKAEIAVRTQRPTLARAYLDSAIDATPSLTSRVTYRRTQALMRLYEGSISDAIAGMGRVAAMAESDSLPGAAATTHATMAILHAAANDAPNAEQELAEAVRLNLSAGTLADNGIIVYALLGAGAKATEVLPAYIEAQRDVVADVRDENVHRMTGLVALANGKYDDAITHLRMGGPNPYAQLGIVEAYTKLGKKKEAAAMRAELRARKNISFASTAAPIALYRATKRK